MRVSVGLGVPVGELVNRITPAELTLWAMYAEQDGPWWGLREEVMLAQCAQTTAATAGVKKSLKDFLPEWSPQETTLLSFRDAMAILSAQNGAKK